MRRYSKCVFGHRFRYMIVYIIFHGKVNDEISKDCMSGVMNQKEELWPKNVCVH